MSGSPNVLTALVLLALFVALLLGLLSYNSRGRSYVNLGIGLLVLATSLALLANAFARPGLATASVVALLAMGIMGVLATYHSVGWATVVFAIGALLFILGLPFLGAGRGDLALLSLIAGPGLLMLVAWLHPEVPARLSRLGAMNAGPTLTGDELAAERRRYTRLAAGITVASLAGIWLFGGVPEGPVTEASAPVVVDAALAQQGAQLFSTYGCTACHSVTGQSGIGPTLKGVYGHTVRLDNGTTVKADEAYIKESIADPDAKTVNGFSKGVMVGTIGPRLPEITQPNNLNALVEYVKSLAK